MPFISGSPFFSVRNCVNSGGSSGSRRNFFDRLEVGRVIFQFCAHLVATQKTDSQFFQIPDGHLDRSHTSQYYR